MEKFVEIIVAPRSQALCPHRRRDARVRSAQVPPASGSQNTSAHERPAEYQGSCCSYSRYQPSAHLCGIIQLATGCFMPLDELDVKINRLEVCLRRNTSSWSSFSSTPPSCQLMFRLPRSLLRASPSADRKCIASPPRQPVRQSLLRAGRADRFCRYRYRCPRKTVVSSRKPC